MASMSSVSNNLITSSENFEDLKCALCLEPVMRKVQTLWCGHSFDLNCVQRAVDGKQNCPLCRREIQPIFGVIQDPNSPTLEQVTTMFKKNGELQQRCDKYYENHPDEAKKRDEDASKGTTKISTIRTSYTTDSSDDIFSVLEIPPTSEEERINVTNIQRNVVITQPPTIQNNEQLAQTYVDGMNEGARRERKACCRDLGIISLLVGGASFLYNRLGSSIGSENP